MSLKPGEALSTERALLVGLTLPVSIKFSLDESVHSSVLHRYRVQLKTGSIERIGPRERQ